MSFADRVVIDTSTLVSAVLRPLSVPRQAFLLAISRTTVCVSTATLDELTRVLLRDKFDRYLDKDSRLRFVQHYRETTKAFPVSVDEEANLKPPCRDPHDNKFLALAQHCSVQLLISSDEDLLALNPWLSIQIVTPAQFLQASEKEKS